MKSVVVAMRMLLMMTVTVYIMMHSGQSKQSLNCTLLSPSAMNQTCKQIKMECFT